MPYKTVNMLPPQDGSLNTVTINGRTYTSDPATPISIPYFDATAVEANGWIRTASFTVPGGGGGGGGTVAAAETTGAMFRRLYGARSKNNRYVNPPIRGCRPWNFANAWAATSAVTKGAILYSGSNFYYYWNGGTTGSTAPSSTDPRVGIADGTARCSLVAIGNLFPVGTVVANGTYGGYGALYILRTAGLPATSGAGPTGGGTGITDGACVWDYYGPQTGPILTADYSTHNAALTNIYTLNSNIIDGQGKVRFDGGYPVIDSGTNFVGIYGASSSAGVYTQKVNPRYTSIVEDVKVEYQVGVGTYVGFEIDDQVVEYSMVLPASITSSYYVTLDFTNALVSASGQSGGVTSTGRARRKITLRTSYGVSAASVNQIACNPSGKIAYPEGDNFSIAFIGDSVSIGTGANSPMVPGNATPLLTDCGPYNAGSQICVRAGLPWPAPLGVGGTGYVTSYNYPTRAMADLANVHAFRPIKAIIFWGSSNDGSQSAAAITAAAAGLYAQIRAVYATQPIIVFGFTFINGATNYTPTENAVAAAVAQRQAAGDTNIYFIPAYAALDGNWITGTGTDAAPTGDGNADFCWNGAVGHPNNNGYNTIGIRGVTALFDQVFQIMA